MSLQFTPGAYTAIAPGEFSALTGQTFRPAQPLTNRRSLRAQRRIARSL